jgi:hypothetical protein
MGKGLSLLQGRSIRVQSNGDRSSVTTAPISLARIFLDNMEPLTPDDVRSMIEKALIPISDELGTLQSQLAKLMAVALDDLSQRKQQSIPKSKLK